MNSAGKSGDIGLLSMLCALTLPVPGGQTTRTTATCAIIIRQLLICHYNFPSNWGWDAIIRPPTTGYVAHTLATAHGSLAYKIVQ